MRATHAAASLPGPRRPPAPARSGPTNPAASRAFEGPRTIVPRTLPYAPREGASFRPRLRDSPRPVSERPGRAIIAPWTATARRTAHIPGGTNDRAILLRIASLPDRGAALPPRPAGLRAGAGP